MLRKIIEDKTRPSQYLVYLGHIRVDSFNFQVILVNLIYHKVSVSTESLSICKQAVASKMCELERQEIPLFS